MGDKSPKSKQKNSTQKQVKTTSAKQATQKAIDAKKSPANSASDKKK